LKVVALFFSGLSNPEQERFTVAHCTIYPSTVIEVSNHASLKANIKNYGRGALSFVKTIKVDEPLTELQLHRLPAWLREKVKVAC
jgi:hypothetical protein